MKGITERIRTGLREREREGGISVLGGEIVGNHCSANRTLFLVPSLLFK